MMVTAVKVSVQSCDLDLVRDVRAVLGSPRIAFVSALGPNPLRPRPVYSWSVRLWVIRVGHFRPGFSRVYSVRAWSIGLTNLDPYDDVFPCHLLDADS